MYTYQPNKQSQGQVQVRVPQEGGPQLQPRMSLPDGSLNKPGFVKVAKTVSAHFEHTLGNSLSESGLEERQQQLPLGPY